MALLVILGLIGLIVAFIGLLKGNVLSLKIKNRKVAAIVFAASLVLTAVAAGAPSNEAEIDVPSSSIESSVAPATEPETSVASVFEPKPEPRDYVAAGTPLEIGKWVVQAGGKEMEPLFTTRLGTDLFGETADKGYVFALVPVAVKNNTRETQSFGILFTWILEDDEGYAYSIQTMADIYLPDNARLRLTNVPPEATRSGFLVFQVREGAANFYLSLKTTLGEGKWLFERAN